MNRAAQISWWSEQAELTRQHVAKAQQRRRSGPIMGLEDEPSRRRGPIAMLPDMPSSRTALHGVTIAGARDEEKSRRLPETSGGGGARLVGSPPSAKAAPVAGGVGSGGGALGRVRQLAAGYQPAVIKVVSYAHGVTRATATGQYVQREDVPLETHDGRMLTDRSEVAEEIRAWSATFSKRAESQDVGAIRLTLHGVPDTREGRDVYEKAIASGLAGHRHAYRLEATPEGMLEAQVVVAMAGAAKERFRLRDAGEGEIGDRVQRCLDRNSMTRVRDRIRQATGVSPDAVSIAPGASNHGRDGVTYRLNRLIEKGPAIDDRGNTIGSATEIRTAAREWGRTLRSQSARDTMHLIISAKAGTDVAALTRAARAFLHDRFADHRFMFGVHTDKEADGHIHAHAVIAVKSESGQKLHPSRETFSQWRQVYAQHAQAEGLKIVATSARERASSQSYGPKDKAIVAAAERPRLGREARDQAYVADPANRGLIDRARRRIQVARANPIRLPVTPAARRAVGEGLVAWKAVATAQPENGMAQSMVERLSMAQAVGAILHAIGRRVDQLTRENSNMGVTSEQMAKDLRHMNEAVSRTSELLDGETKKQFREASARYLETLANRVDLQRAQERGVTQMTRAEVEAIVGPNADRLVERANALRQREAREAVAATRLADRAIEVGRREESATSFEPISQHELRAKRAIVASTQKSAAEEAREAAATAEAARSLARNPAEALSPAVVQTEALARLRAGQEQVMRELEASERPKAITESVMQRKR
ncbi:MAG TPA: relaxase/mobilization nuclease domain-containing protein [Bosea sp. (in: a-proteobacteria)]|jgi:type IV secretory pathway VirD2 relaxase|nr:relaxase/mobilization nuclease domain-containing protein [Bosea sp. (in: a-proteobacteria)]